MLFAFGSVIAMGLPILTAVVGVGMGFGVLEVLSHLVTVPTFGPDMMVMIGLGVGIDYALFVVTRYRQGLFEGRPPREATVVALFTAGRRRALSRRDGPDRALGLFVVNLPFMDGLAAATIVAVALVLAAALTLLPRRLRLRRAGDRPAPRPRSAGATRRGWRPRVLVPLEPHVQRRPAVQPRHLRARGASAPAVLDASGVQ